MAHNAPRSFSEHRCRWRYFAGTKHPQFSAGKRRKVLSATHTFERLVARASSTEQFDAEKYSQKYPISSWYTFVPYREDWSGSAWIEIDRQQVRPPAFLSGKALWDKWVADKEHRAIMPYIEAAYIGASPRAFFRRAFRASSDGMAPLPLV